MCLVHHLKTTQARPTKQSIGISHLNPNLKTKISRDAKGQQTHRKCMQNSSFKSINESDESSISWYKKELAVVAELQTSPFTGSVILHLKGGKWTLQERKNQDSPCAMQQKGPSKWALVTLPSELSMDTLSLFQINSDWLHHGWIDGRRWSTCYHSSTRKCWWMGFLSRSVI